jgi:hypothetical protein
MDSSLDDVCDQLSTQNRLIVIRLCIDDAIASAESVLDTFYTDCPEDARPRQAIEAARAVGAVLDRHLAGQAQWQEVERIVEAAWQALDAVSFHTSYTVKKWSAYLASDAACHAVTTAGEAIGRAAEAVRNAACAAASAAVSRWLAETGEKPNKADEWQRQDNVYKTKREELQRIAAWLVMKQE